MGKKKILIVSNAFYPEISPRSFRTTELAKEFARQGHRVRIITHSHPDQEKLVREFDFEVKDLGERKWKPVMVKGKGVTRWFRRVISRITGLFFEYPNIELRGMIKKALADEAGYDLMISVAVPYPVHWGVAATRHAKEAVAKVWVADCGDPYMGQENDSFKPPFYFSIPEKNFCRKADYITVPTEGAVNGYYPQFREKIKVIPQGFRFEDIKKYDGPRLMNKPFFGYAGMFIPGRRDPSEFLSYVNTLKEDFLFHIYTTTPQFVEPFIAASDGRVVIKPVIPREQLLHEMSKMDFVVNFENAGSKQTPSKLIDYAIIQKPVLSVQTGRLNKRVVHEFLEGNYKGALSLPDATQYQIENVCKQFLQLAGNE